MGVDPSIFGLSQLLMGCVLYTVVMISVINRVFALIHVVPDRILRWIGGSAADLGQDAHGIESNTAAKVMAGAHVSQQLGSSMTQGVQAGREANQRQRGNALSAEASAQQAAGNSGDGADRSGRQFQDSIRDARDGHASAEDVQNKGRAAAVAEFAHGVNMAKLAVARAEVPENRRNADIQTQADSARSFLAELGKKDSSGNQYNSANPDSIAKFAQEKGGDRRFAGQPWGQSTKSAAGYLARAEQESASIRSAGASPQPQQNDDNSGDDNNKDKPA